MASRWSSKWSRELGVAYLFFVAAVIAWTLTGASFRSPTTSTQVASTTYVDPARASGIASPGSMGLSDLERLVLLKRGESFTTTSSRPTEALASTSTSSPPTTARPASTTSAASPAKSWTRRWDKQADCESGERVRHEDGSVTIIPGTANWQANTGNGYYGGLQFSLPSWRGVGGTGLPSQASRDEQIERAEALIKTPPYERHWPNCHQYG